ncbi:hypothetical protein Ccrd_022656, partial [Cynara cardunculus var. scolymus]
MSTVWFSLKKSFHCESDSADVHDPKPKTHLSAILTRKPSRWGCSRSIANLKDVINGGSKRHSENPVNCSPRSIGSNEFPNPITHEVILNNSKCEIKITGFGGGFHDGIGGSADGSPLVGTLLAPVSGGNSTMQYSKSTTPRRTISSMERGDGNGIGNSVHLGITGAGGKNTVVQKPRMSSETETNGSAAGGVTCHKKIVEIICRSSWSKSETSSGRIEKVLKVHNMQKTLARFEEYRELVKTKAGILPKKHPRCRADGNELLRFYGATISCSLGINGASSLCISDKCSVCRIIRDGFSAKREVKGGIGVFTTSTSIRAFESIEVLEESPDTRKALIVCRVIAGRVHRPLEDIQEMAGQSGFDSLAGKVGLYSNIEELYLLSPKALLPCFVVICKP